MTTTLPIDTWVRTRYHNEWEYGRLVLVETTLGIELGNPPAGTLVQPCVWKKGDILEPRGKPVTYKS